MAGAAQELHDAVVINPYDVVGFTDALERAVDMPIDERHHRMRAMRRVVAGRNIFDWASHILEGLDPQALPPAPVSPVRPRRKMPVPLTEVKS